MITGANSGIGYVTSLELARKGAHVIMVCRNREKGEAAKLKITQETKNDKIDLFIADFNSQASIRSMVSEFKLKNDKLEVLINNAGTTQSKRRITQDGLEMTFGVNHIGPFLLTTLLLNTLKASAPARIINVSSGLHHQVSTLDLDDLQFEKRKYRYMDVYGASKLCNVLFTYELHERLQAENIKDVTVNAVHPGFIRTNLGRDGGGFFQKYLFHYLIRPLIAKSPDKGAETSIYLASSPEVAGISGKYFVNKEPRRSSELSYDRELQKKLWIISEKIVSNSLL